MPLENVDVSIVNLTFLRYRCEACGTSLETHERWSTGRPRGCLCRGCWSEATRAQVTARLARAVVSAGLTIQCRPLSIPTDLDTFSKLAQCNACSSPATVGGMCVYCANRHGLGFDEPKNLASLALGMTVFPGAQQARARMNAADRRDAPKSTASSRELAKGHPASWPSNEGEE